MRAVHLFVLLLLPSTALAGGRKAAKAEALSDRAMELLAEEDVAGANKKIGKALKKAPDDPLHHFRQAEIYGVMAARVGDPQFSALLEQGSAMHYAWVLEHVEPTDLLAVLARMNLEERQAWMELPDPGCSADAQVHWDAAEVAFGQHDAGAAQAAYAKAVEGCPEHATLRVYYGDVFHIQNDFAGAVAQYQVALELEPCHWQAHRFLADSYIALGEVEGTFAHLATSIACNPGYTPAWAQLSGILGHLGIEVRQPVVDKQHMLALVATDSLPEGKEPSSEVSLNARVWSGYAEALAAEKDQRPEAATLEQERAAVRAALAGLDTDLAPVSWKLPGLQVWGLLARADQQGQLDMAIFVLLHDQDLADDFLAWREDNIEALREWILSTMVLDPEA
jgi:Tfp pilus assembly protein PilF